jgi:hypothetical protein
MDWLIGRTGYSLLDYWTLSHAAFWLVAGSTLAALKAPRVISYICCLAGAVLWEVFERFAEHLWPTVWLSPESFMNAWVSDLLSTLAVLLAFYGFDKWRK